MKYDDYFKEKEESNNNNDEYVKLGEIIKYVKYKSQMISHEKKNGKYPFYNSSIINHLYCDEYTNNEECLIINKVNGTGKCKIYYNNGPFSATSAVIVFKCIETINIKYLLYYLNLNISIVESKYTGSDKKSLNNANFEKIKIPNLSLEHQDEIVNFLDKQFENYNINNMKKDIPIFKLLINKQYDMAAELLHIVYRQMAAELECENIKKDIKAIFKLNVYNLNSEICKLGDIVNFDIGGTPSRKESKYFNGNNLWVSVSELNNNIINDTKEKITDLGIEKSSVKLIKKGSILLSFKLSIGKMGIAGKDMYCNEAIAFFKHDNIITNKYLYNWFLYNDISKYASGQIGVGSLNKTSLYNIKIPLPSLEIQEEIINKIEKLNEHNSHYESYSNMLKTEIDNIIEIINNMTFLSNKEESDNEKSNSEESDNEESDNEIQEIEYKNKLYHLIDDKIYNINEDGKTGILFANYINGKIKKI